MTLLPGDDSQEMIRNLKEASKKKSSTWPSHYLPSNEWVSINVSEWIINSPKTNNQCIRIWGIPIRGCK